MVYIFRPGHMTKMAAMMMGGHCNTRNVVYLLSCTVCESSVYVGETERALKERMAKKYEGIP